MFSIDNGSRNIVANVANLRRGEALTASGALAALLASGAKLTDQVLLLQALDQDDSSLALRAKRIGGPLLFGWLGKCSSARYWTACWRRAGFGFAVERAMFLATLHRLFVSGSDRDCVSDGRLWHWRRAGWLAQRLGHCRGELTGWF
jgi:hypothetical protein